MELLDIPSVNSTDLNKMLTHVLGSHRLWQPRNQSAIIVTEEDSDNDLSPEPRTPCFGSSMTPTFSESNCQFGFSFSRFRPETNGPVRVVQKKPDPNPQSQETDGFKIPFQSYAESSSQETLLAADSQNVTNGVPGVAGNIEHSVTIPNLSVIPAVLPGDSADKPNSFIKFLNDPITISPELLNQYKQGEGHVALAPECLDGRIIEVVDAAQTVEQGHACVETDTPDPPTPMDVQQSEHVTVIQDSICLTPQSDEQFTPTVTENIASKPSSYIKFLNDPIPIPHELYTECARLEGAAVDTGTTLDEANDTQTIVIGANDAQTIGPGLVYSDTNAAKCSSFKDLEPTDPTIVTKSVSDSEQISCETVVSNNMYFQIGEERAIYADTSQSESDSLLMDVAAYQSVDDSSFSSSDVTYTELLPTSPRQDEPSSQDSEDAQQPRHNINGAVTDALTDEIQAVMASCDNVGKELEQKLRASLKPGHSLKLKLNKKIQTKRLQEGKGELKVTFEERPLSKPTDEEVEKAETRKQKNRDSAVKSRERRQNLMQNLEKDVKQLERENKRLMMEIETLKIKKEQDLKRITEYCDCFKSESNSTSDQQDQPSTSNSKSFQQALSAFFSLRENT